MADDPRPVLGMKVTANHRQRRVVLAFNRPIMWVGMSRDEAIAVAEVILEKAMELGDSPTGEKELGLYAGEVGP